MDRRKSEVKEEYLCFNCPKKDKVSEYLYDRAAKEQEDS